MAFIGRWSEVIRSNGRWSGQVAFIGRWSEVIRSSGLYREASMESFREVHVVHKSCYLGEGSTARAETAREKWRGKKW